MVVQSDSVWCLLVLFFHLEVACANTLAWTLKILLLFNILLKNIPKCGIVVVSKKLLVSKKEKREEKKVCFATFGVVLATLIYKLRKEQFLVRTVYIKLYKESI